MIFLFHLFFLVTISTIYFKYFTDGLKKFFFPFLLLKIVCGLAYGIIYLHYYNHGDTFSYFHEGSKIGSLAAQDFSTYLKLLFFDEIPDSLTLSYTHLNNPRAYWMSKSVSLILIFTDFNYWVSSCYLSLFSFFGTFFLAETMHKRYPNNKQNVILSFFLFPSFVFWSSGLTKESIAIGSLFYMIAICLKAAHGEKISIIQWIVFILFSWFLFQIRFFYLAVFILTFGLFTVYQLIIKNFDPSFKKTLFLFIGIFLVFVFLVSQMSFALNFSNFIDILYLAYEKDYDQNPTNAIQYYNFNPTFWSLAMNSPLALISGLFRPSLLDVQNVPILLVAIENSVLLVLFFMKLKNIFRGSTLEKVIWVYIGSLALFLALSSPNFGTLTRYKVAFLPLFLFLLLMDRKLSFPEKRDQKKDL